ncbi:MAG: dihydrofolate reductase [Erythrobacter sp.]
MGLFMIYARASNGTIGKDGGIPWHIPNDMKRFKRLTMGSAMIMGRKTFESFPKPLPGRRHIVLTRSKRWQAEGAEVVHSVNEALDLAANTECSVIGGAEIYALFEPHADRIELTEVHGEFDGDTVMPATGPEWVETAREDHPAEDGRPAYSFVTLERAP